ncbi:MAG: radical SAM protein [Candidatus Auribacterota bacterium]|nr:radical SAM protein [Candidatus Auribacterota bacterium]
MNSDERFKELLDDGRQYDLRILLIHKAESEELSHEPVLPTGIAILAAICKKKGVSVRCLDYSVTHYDQEDLNKIIREGKIDVVGLSATTQAIPRIYNIVKAIKESHPRIITVMGGPHVTVLYEEAIENGADIVVRNEGELTFLELLPLLEGATWEQIAGQLESVQGIAYRGPGGEIRVNPSPDRIRDLDLIPFPDRDSFDFPDKYHMAIRITRGNSFSLLGTRGCPGHCFFCSRAVFGHAVSARSPENMVEEICLVKEKYPEITQFEFLDDYLLFDLERMNRFCDLMIERKVDLYWSAGNSRVDNIDLDTLKKMKDSGCFKINYGIEAGTDEILKSINKEITIADARRAIEVTHQAGLYVGVYFILGHHRETVEDIEATIRLARSLPADAVQFTINTPWPGTSMYRYLEKKDFLLSKNWDDYQYFKKPVFHTENLTPEILEKMLHKAYLSYYFNPRLYFRHLKNLLSTRRFYLYFTTLSLILSNLFNREERKK